MTTAIPSRRSYSAAFFALVLLSCGGTTNAGNTIPGSDPVPNSPGTADTSTVPIITKIPWVNAGIPQVDASGNLVTSPDVYYPPLATSTIADYGQTPQNVQPNGDDSIVTTTPIDCSVLAPYQFAPWVATSEPERVLEEIGDPSITPDVGFAMRWAGADDYTRGSWRVPGFTSWYPTLSADMTLGVVWGTPSEKVPPGTLVPQCDGKPNNWVIHMRGAGFRYYGGNIAHILGGDNFPTSTLHCPDGSDLCQSTMMTDPNHDSAGFPLTPTENTGGITGYQLTALHTYWDVSKYDGVSFWARRGRDSMGTLGITLADKHTSDDMNRQNETYCKRIYACHKTCQNYQQCLPSTVPMDNTMAGDPVNRCVDPDIGFPMDVPVGGSLDAELDAVYPRCGTSACTFRTTYPDADFEGKDCRPYTFTSGESNEYCFNADDPPPPSRF
ncbi:MAG TPA: hypothetical protein VGM44_06100, partial [Polyangiaceae bacterium]